jgi:hypothetical protein
MHPTAIILALRGYKLCRYVSLEDSSIPVDPIKSLRIKQQRLAGEAMLTRSYKEWRVVTYSLVTDQYYEIKWESIDQSVLDRITDRHLTELP